MTKWMRQCGERSVELIQEVNNLLKLVHFQEENILSYHELIPYAARKHETLKFHVSYCGGKLGERGTLG